VLVLVLDLVQACDIYTIGSGIILDAHDGTPR